MRPAPAARWAAAFPRLARAGAENAVPQAPAQVIQIIYDAHDRMSQAVASLQQQRFELVQDYPQLNFLVAKPLQSASAIPLPGQPTAAVQATTAQRVSALSQAQGIVQVRKDFIVRALEGGINKGFASQYSAGTCPGDWTRMLVADLHAPDLLQCLWGAAVHARSNAPPRPAVLNPLKPNTKQVTPYGVSYVGGDSAAVIKAAKVRIAHKCSMLAAPPSLGPA
jgi:hypothetical protein